MINLPQDNQIDVRTLERVLSDQYITLSYKIFWFNSIVGFVAKGRKVLKFQEIVYEMIASAWYMVTEYKLKLGYKDTLQKLIEYIYENYNISSSEKKEKIVEFLTSNEDKEIDKMVKIICNYVPYRLITPFYDMELRNIKDDGRKRNLAIMELSYNDERAIYRFSYEKESITINPNWANYIKNNQNILNGWIKYKLIRYLQKKNPNVPSIPFKLEPPYTRNLTVATKYWKEVGKRIPLTDIYIDKEINEENIQKYGSMSIDHFIPWSFIMHDELWNLLPCFKNVNSAKSNRLPDMNWCFDRFCDLQYKGYIIAGENRALAKSLEDYLGIYTQKLTTENILKGTLSREKFTGALKETIVPLYQIAYNQGFPLWDMRYEHE